MEGTDVSDAAIDIRPADSEKRDVKAPGLYKPRHVEGTKPKM